MAKKRSDGRIRKTFTYQGKRYYSYGRTTKEAAENMRKKLQELESGYQERKDPTIQKYFDTLTETRQGTVSGHSLYQQNSRFKQCAAVQIRKAGRTFGELKLSEITPDDIRELQRILSETRSTNTTNQIINIIRLILKTAVIERYLSFNPCDPVKSLRRTEEEARDTIHRALTKEETEAFFKAAKGNYYFNLFRLAICTGARLGELGALTDQDITADQIRIEKTITRSEAGAFIVGDKTKTAKSKRTIPLNDQIRAIITDQRKQNRDFFGIQIHDRLFKSLRGDIIMSGIIGREMKAICTAAGITPFTFHAFRDTFATRALEQGMNPRTLQEILGHSDFGMTMNLYGHVLDDTKREAMNSITIAV